MSAKLTGEQILTVRRWAEEGMDLNAIQKALKDEFGLHLTYMDTRFLILDHHIELRTPAAPGKDAAPAQEETPLPAQQPEAAGGVRITVDELQQPGMYLSGKVSFPSGATGSWFFDTLGQLSWEPGAGKPTPAEMADFQKELGRVLRSRLGQI
ncbi:MAG: hypothetical protein LUE08_01645 [Akkermansiaceae bacterium]|nr:hypothetical protein [Akkermansiaceae bacterium]